MRVRAWVSEEREQEIKKNSWKQRGRKTPSKLRWTYLVPGEKVKDVDKLTGMAVKYPLYI